MFDDYKLQIMQIANTEGVKHLLWNRWRIEKEPPIVDVGKNYITQYLGGRQLRSTFFPRVPVKHLFLPVLTKVNIANDYKKYDLYSSFLHYSDLEPESNRYPQIYLAESTFNPDADPESNTVDGRVLSQDSTYSTARDAATGDFAFDDGTNDVEMRHEHLSGNYNVERFFMLFDTSSIGDNDTIDSATAEYHLNDKNSSHDDTVELVTTTPASNTAIATGDFDQVGSTSNGSWGLISNQTTGQHNAATLNATGEGNINKTGITKFGGRAGDDIGNSAPPDETRCYTVAYSAEQTGTSNDPKLVVTHTAPAAEGTPFDLTSRYW